jgi:hypothetical protein
LPPLLRESTAAELVRIIKNSRKPVSFGQILVQANLQGVLSWHRTLRRYLDLLVQSDLLKVEEKDVGSVHPQQLYTIQHVKTRLWTGLEALALHGLNWDTPGSDLFPVLTDLAALVRSRPVTRTSMTRLITGLEDSLAYELLRDLARESGGTELVTGLLATRPVDLAYLLRRSDLLGIGDSTRQLMSRIIETYLSIPQDVDGRVFLQTRERFLKLQHLYSTRGTLRLLETPGRGRRGINVVKGLSPAQIVSASGKQLGVIG